MNKTRLEFLLPKSILDINNKVIQVHVTVNDNEIPQKRDTIQLTYTDLVKELPGLTKNRKLIKNFIVVNVIKKYSTNVNISNSEYQEALFTYMVFLDEVSDEIIQPQ